LEQSRDDATDLFAYAPTVKEILSGYSARALGPRPSFLASFVKLPWRHLDGIMTGFRIRSLAKREVREIGGSQGLDRRDMRALTRQVRRSGKHVIANARRVASFSFYERLFSLWHVLHIPLFIALVAAAIFHVIAVQRY
jgi:hypothetical protein